MNNLHRHQDGFRSCLNKVLKLEQLAHSKLFASSGNAVAVTAAADLKRILFSLLAQTLFCQSVILLSTVSSDEPRVKHHKVKLPLCITAS